MNITSNREHMVMTPAVSWWTESVCVCDSVISEMCLILV